MATFHPTCPSLFSHVSMSTKANLLQVIQCEQLQGQTQTPRAATQENAFRTFDKPRADLPRMQDEDSSRLGVPAH